MGLRARFLISLVIITATLTMAALLIVRQNVRVHVQKDLASSLENSAETFQQVQRRRELDGQRTTELIANAPVLKAVMTTRHAATIQDASKDLWRMAGADLLLIADPQGQVMGLHTAGSEMSSEEAAQLIRGSLSAGRPTGWWHDGQLYEVFLRPVYAGGPGEQNFLGTLAVGYAINRSLAEQMARIVDGPVAFCYRDRVIVSTFDSQRQQQLQSAATGGSAGILPAAATDRSRQPVEVTLGGETFLAAAVQLNNEPDASVQLLMLKSYDRATIFLRRLNWLVLLVGGAAVLLGALLVSLTSHRYSQPLAELLTGVRALENGDFLYPLQTSSKHDEVAELTSAFDRMRKTLQEGQARMVNAARMEAVGQLAGGVAHDFNNFVTIIKGYSDLLLMKIDPEDPIATYADQIKKAGDRAAGVTRQLLAFSRKQVVQPQLLDVHALSANLSKMLRVLIGEDIEVKITSEAGLRKVLADPGQIEQVLMNLAVNARDAMPTGGRLLIETTNAEVPSAAMGAPQATTRYVKIAVGDTGCGMSPEVKAQIFQPFFTTKAVGKGTGLGLSIVENIVRKNGGFVTVDSEVGRGTTFNLFFPEAAALASPAVAGSESRHFALTGRETVLVVEDEDALRALARESLRLGGYQVVDAENGEVALEKLRELDYKVDLVLTDVVMPRVGGIELAEKIRESRKSIHVLLMSGYTERVQEVENSQFPLLLKPFTPEQLIRRVSEIFRGSAARAAALA